MDYLHLLLTNTKKPISHVITAVTGERFNHASIAFDAGLTESYSFNMAKNGFVREDRREWPTWTEFELYEVPVTASGRAVAYEYVKAVAGGRLRFSFAGLAGVVVGRPLASREAMFCSEFVERACLAAGLAPAAPDPALATPESPGSRRVATGALHQYLLRSALTPGYRPNLVETAMNNLNEVCIELDLPLAEFSVGDYLRNPSSIGAVSSSSAALGDAMAALVPPGRGVVVELGPGDGALTRRLVASGIRQEDLVLIELEEGFLATLRAEFPRAQLVHGSAERLLEIVGRHPVRSVGTPSARSSRVYRYAACPRASSARSYPRSAQYSAPTRTVSTSSSRTTRAGRPTSSAPLGPMAVCVSETADSCLATSRLRTPNP